MKPRFSLFYGQNKLLAHIETLVETLNASAGVNQLLFAGKERMAF